MFKYHFNCYLLLNTKDNNYSLKSQQQYFFMISSVQICLPVHSQELFKMNFNIEDITDPIVVKVCEKQQVKKYSLVTPNFGNNQPCVLTPRYSNFAEKIRNFKINSDDTWVLSYPKTGTTWTQEMVWLICNNLDYKGAEILVDIRFPFLESVKMC